MTFRVRPVDRGRAGHDPNRRNLYMNIGFGIAVFIAVVILVVVGVTSWYGQHLAAAATVDGQTITKDQFAERAAVESFRLQQLAQRVNAELAAGRLTAAQAQARTDCDQQTADDPTTFATSIVEKLIDTTIQAKLATEEGITITPDQIDQRILDDKTRREERHVLLIAVAPVVDTGKTDPTDAQKAAAKKNADDALAAIKSGAKTFADEAKAVSTDPSNAGGGDLGWIDSTASEDPDWQAALFKLDSGGTTDVILGADGTYRIGQVTEIAPAQVDAAWDQKLADAKISQDAYRAAIQSEAIRTALGDKVVADDSKAGSQRQVAELLIAAPQTPPADGAIKVRHILYSPNHDPSNASTVPDTRPGLDGRPARRPEGVRRDQGEPVPVRLGRPPRERRDLGPGRQRHGRQAPLLRRHQRDRPGIRRPDPEARPEPRRPDPAVQELIRLACRPGHVPAAGHRRDEQAQGRSRRRNFLRQPVRDFSDGPESGAGGDIGWVPPGQLDDRLAKAILAAPVGGLSDVVEIPNKGVYLFKVVAEKTAAPDATQLQTIKANAFQNWYAARRMP